MAGLTCAQELMQRGVNVVVFDKGRGLGGRMATRRAEGGFQFDHGAQYLTPLSDGFSLMLKRAEAAGAVARWPQDREEPAYVGVPGMTSLAKYLGIGLNIREETRIESIMKSNGRWKLVWQGDNETFDRVVITAPAPQIGALLPDAHYFNAALGTVGMIPCLTLMVGLHCGVELPFVSRREPDDDISWIVCDNAKPGRPDATCIVAKASSDWSLRHLERDMDEFAKLMLPPVAAVVGVDLMADPAYISGHRWRYAFVSRPLGQRYLADKEETLFAGGDWCLGGKAEHAWTSGQAIAEKIANGL
jgi:predicted NAD/FAD-dependent oxidoreductase